MPATAFNLDGPTVARLAKALRAYERSTGQGGDPGKPTASTPRGPWFAKLVGESAGKPGNYSWTYVTRQSNGGWSERTPRVFDSSCSAADLNGRTGIAAGTVVRMSWAGTSTTSPPTDPSPAPAAAGTNDSDLNATTSPSPFPAYQFEVSPLPTGLKYQVVMFIDDAGTVGADWPRMH